MHGRVKVRTTEEQRERARLEKCKKAKIYQESMKIVQEKRSSKCYDQEALDLTASLLMGNPDIITLWNYRREIFINLKDPENLDDYQKLLEKDLGLTEQCLKVNPKSYGSWHHRIWILDHLPQPDWGKEVKICTKYLQLDERNFHCWDYRRIVTSKANVSNEAEYKYTLEKIETNFSNYSAWHLRSKLLPKIFPDPDKKFPINEKKHQEELELVENAAFTDPNDQSAWFYLRWLLNLTEPRVSFLYANREENKILLVTSKNIILNKTACGVNIKVKVNNETVSGVWKSSIEPSCVWTFELNSVVQECDAVSLILEENNIEYSTTLLLKNKPFYNRPVFHPVLSDGLKETLTNQLSTCEQLLELEPDSKWTLLTSVFLMLSIDSNNYKTLLLDRLNKLSLIDPLRKGYYLDLKSKVLWQMLICDIYSSPQNFIFSNQNLNDLYCPQYLCYFENIDLSNNNLSCQVLRFLSSLVNCKVLNLRKNKIKDLGNLPGLQNLEVLILDDNKIECINENWLNQFPKLKTLSVLNNPVSQEKSLADMLCKKLSNIQILHSS